MVVVEYQGKYQRWENITDARTCWWNVSYLLNLQGISEKYPGGEIEATTLSREPRSLERVVRVRTGWKSPDIYLGRGAGACSDRGRARRQEGEEGEGGGGSRPWRSGTHSGTRSPCQHSSSSPGCQSAEGSGGSQLLHCSFTLISILTREFT